MEKNKKKIIFIMILVILLSILKVSYDYTTEKGGGTGIYNINTKQFIHRPPNIVIENMINKRQGIYYYGFPTCPWCQELIPIFDTVLNKENLNAYAVDTRGRNYTAKDNIKLERFFIKYVTNKKRLTVPLIIMINKNKNIKFHVATVYGHNAEIEKMRPQQVKKLKKIITNMCRWYKSN